MTNFTATHAGYTFKRSSAKLYTHAIVVEKSMAGASPTFTPSRLSADGKSFFCNASWSQSLDNAQKTAARDRNSRAMRGAVIAVHILPATAG